MARKLLSDFDRLSRSFVELASGCWQWTLARDRDGYGCFRVGSRSDGTRRQARAHCWAYEHFVGPVPAGFQVDHKCNNRGCVNPDHLQVVTSLRNTQLGWERGTHKPHFTPHRPETREKIRAKAIGRKASAETRRKMSLAHLRRRVGAEETSNRLG